MIPYFEWHTIPIGPLHLQVWGLFAALGIAAATLLGRRVAKGRGLDAERFTDLAALCVVGGLVGARVFHVVAYRPATLLTDPLLLLRMWEGGLSMFGGLLGGALAAWLAFRRDRAEFRRYAEVVAFVIPLGYAIARVGCFLIHDHPGTLSSSLLAVRFPAGSRLDLGLLQMFDGLAIMALFAWLAWRAERRGAPPPSFLRLFLLCYGVSRFFLDFLRATDLAAADARYLGLTPGQYVALAFVVVGAACFRRTPPSPTPKTP